MLLNLPSKCKKKSNPFGQPAKMVRLEFVKKISNIRTLNNGASYLTNIAKKTWVKIKIYQFLFGNFDTSALHISALH